jgi:hypothetical protein
MLLVMMMMGRCRARSARVSRTKNSMGRVRAAIVRALVVARGSLISGTSWIRTRTPPRVAKLWLPMSCTLLPELRSARDTASYSYRPCRLAGGSDVPSRTAGAAERAGDLLRKLGLAGAGLLIRQSRGERGFTPPSSVRRWRCIAQCQ